MRLLSAVCAVALCAGLARANEIPPTQLASLGWAMSASSGAISSGAGPSGGISGALAVYAGCTAPPSAPDSYSSSKDWYFDVANGHPPAYYDNLGVPEAQWGDVSHPFDNPNAIWGQNTISNVQTDWPGWGSSTYPVATNSLHILALYGSYRTTGGKNTSDGLNASGVEDFGNPTTYDPNHYRLWPGDTVYLRGDSAGDSFGSVNFNSGTGTVLMWPNYNEDGSGNTKWVWIKADPNFPAPFFAEAGSSAFSIQQARGVILQGLNALQRSDFTALTSAGLGNLPSTGSPQGSGGPTGHANNAVIEATTTGGTGSGATFDLTFNTSGQVQGLTLRNPGTGYSDGDSLTVVQNSGLPTANAPSGVGSLTGFTITVTAPNTLLAGQGLPFTSNVMNAVPTVGDTISVNTDDNGTIKTFTYGTGTNPIPYPGTPSIVDAELDASYTLNNDPAVSAVMTNAITGASSFPATWKTLTPITAPPSNGNTFTFGYDGSMWTWVTSGATGNQINIPGTNTVANAVAAANTALAAAYPALAFTSVTTGSTGVSWTGTSGANDVWSPAIPATAAPDLPAVNSTFTYAGVSTNDVWTFVASGATGHQVNIGASVQDTYNNIQTALQAAYANTTVTLPTQGANLQFTAVHPGVAGILMLTTTLPMVNANVNAAPVPFLFIRNDSSNNIGVSVKGGATGITAVDTSTSPMNIVATALSSSAPPVGAIGTTDFVSGATFKFNGVTYTWGSTGTNPVALGGTANLSLANLAAVVSGTGPGGTSNTGYQSTLANVQAGELADTQDVILDNINLTGWAGGVGHTFNPYVSDYPSNGSLGIDPATGKHGGWAHSYWNVLDWLETPAFGAIQIAGNRSHSDGGLQPIIGVSCVALTNSYVHQIPTVSLQDAYNSLIRNVNINYNSDGDSYDIYTSHDVELNNSTAYNPLNPLKGIHPDGVQFGSGSGFNVLFMKPFLFSNVNIFNNKFFGGTDSILNDSIGHPELFTTGFDSVSYPLIDLQSALNDTGMRITGAQVKGNVFYTDNILVYLAEFQNSVIANNTALNHGSSPALGNGGITVGVQLHAQGVSNGNNVVVNNLSVGLGYSDTAADACADTTNTFLNNLVIPAYVNGALNNPAAGGFMCARAVPPDGGTLGSGYAATAIPAHNPMEDGQITYQPSSAVISTLIQAFTPPNNEIADPTTLNAEPPGYPSAPTGGLVNAGTAVGGYAPTTNTDGKPWPHGGAPDIGAY